MAKKKMEKAQMEKKPASSGKDMKKASGAGKNEPVTKAKKLEDAMAMDFPEKKVRFKYVIPDTLPDLYVNGVYGGVSPRGEIHMHLFSERPPVPKSLTCDITADGRLKNFRETAIEEELVRIVQSTSLMDVNTAMDMRDWLDEMISLALDMIEDMDEEGIIE